MLPRPVEDKVRKEKCYRQGIISNGGCTNNCIKLRINAGDKSTSNGQDKAIANAYGNKFIIPLDFESWTVRHPITKQDLKTDYVTKLLSMITTELPNQQYHHQKFKMLNIRSQTYP